MNDLQSHSKRNTDASDLSFGMVKFTCSGNGNAASPFFVDSNLASNITGVDKELIYRLPTILRMIACGLPVDHKTFKAYTLATANHYVSLYNWYYMCPSVHKILIHVSDIIQHDIVLIGELPEETRYSDC